MRQLALACVIVLLGLMVVSAQTSTANQLVVSFESANDPLCASATANDCIKGARLFWVDSSNVEHAIAGDIGLTSFAVQTGTILAATVAVPSVSGQRYGSTTFTAKMLARDASGAEVISDAAVSIQVVRRPPRPAVTAK